MNLLENLTRSHVDGTWSAYLFPSVSVRTYTCDWMSAAYETRGPLQLDGCYD